MFSILNVIPSRKKKTASGWFSFNAVCCHHKGHNPDTRSRGGIKFENDFHWIYHCFNCSYSCGFELGKPISDSTRKLLEWSGIDQRQISKWNLESLKHKDLLDYVIVKQKKLTVTFSEVELPDGEIIDPDNPNHKVYVDYLAKRKINATDYPLLITPDEPGRQGLRIVVPYSWNNKIVGYISRYLDNRIPKYIKEQQPGYVFGLDFQKPEYEVCILVEGIFDALCLRACALTHNSISDEQATILARLNKKIIYVPDQDKAGLEVCDRALELGYSISIPNWDKDVKDANDAVVKYGKFPTLLSIMQCATTSKIKVELEKRRIEKRQRK